MPHHSAPFQARRAFPLLVIATSSLHLAPAEATIIYRSVNQQLPGLYDGTSPVRTEVDLDGDGIPDVFFEIGDSFGSGHIPGVWVLAEGITFDFSLSDRALLAGELMGESVPTLAHLFGVLGPVHSPFFEIGTLRDGASPIDGLPVEGVSLIGFRFGDLFGWMRIEATLLGGDPGTPASRFRLIDFAMESEPFTPIAAGAVPAPATLACIGVGLACPRRRSRHRS